MKDQRGEEINNEPKNNNDQNPLAVFLIFLRLGPTSFGGPSPTSDISERSSCHAAIGCLSGVMRI